MQQRSFAAQTNTIDYATIARFQQLLNCGYHLIFIQKKTENPTPNQLVSHKNYTKKEADQFIALLETLTGATHPHFLAVESSANQDLYSIIIEIDNTAMTNLNQMEKHKQEQLNNLANFLNQINYPNDINGNWIVRNQSLCFEANNQNDLKNWTDSKLETEIKSALYYYFKDCGIDTHLENITSDMERDIYNTRYSPNDSISLSKFSPTFYPLHMSPMYLLLIKVMNAFMALNHTLTDTDYTIDYSKRLGSGTYGNAYLGSYNNQPIAIKLSKPYQTKSYDSLQYEKKFFEYLTHAIAHDETKHIGAECIIQYIGHQNQGVNAGFALVLEFAHHGSLNNYIYNQSNARLPLNEKLALACDIAKGLSCLHHYDIIHCDIKPDNVLLVNDVNSNSLHAKLTDLGVSHYKTNKGRPRGTILYHAPEVLNKRVQNQKSDVYSMGLTLWEMMAEKEPYQHHDQSEMQLYHYVVMLGKRPEFPDDCPVNLSSVIQRFWQQKPKQRPSASECVTMLTDLNQNDLKMT